MLSKAALARGAHRAAFVAALEADPVKELLSHGGMVAVAYGGDHVTAVVAQVLHRAPGRDVALVGDQAGEHEEQTADNGADDPAGEAEAFGLEGEGGPEAGHVRAIPQLGLISVPWFVCPGANRWDGAAVPGTLSVDPGTHVAWTDLSRVNRSVDPARN